METIEIGRRLRQLREQNDQTLKDIAALTGLSTGFISQVERGQTDPSLASLKKLTAAYRISLVALFDQQQYSCVVTRRNQGAKLEISHQVTCELLAPTGDKIMEPTIKYIKPGGSSGLVDGHAGEEFVMVLTGVLEITVGGEVYVLSEGDSIYYQANQNHAWVNKSNQLCSAIWVMTPPSYS